jgi:phospholipid/cholesterol/gamma-HCH transport system permease protein
LAACVSPPIYGRLIGSQMLRIGYFSLPVVGLTALSTGAVLALQIYLGGNRYGAEAIVPQIVVLGITRELGPVIAGLMVAGRVAAAIAAEIGTMKVTEQIDALRTLATHPVDYLVVPRLLAALTTLPLLTVESITMGILSGYIVGVCLLDIDPAFLFNNMVKYTGSIDVMFGVTKAIIFGGILAIIGCYKGLSCGEGAEGVGRATTEAVVYASITILISNFFLTLTLNQLFHLYD